MGLKVALELTGQLRGDILKSAVDLSADPSSSWRKRFGESSYYLMFLDTDQMRDPIEAYIARRGSLLKQTFAKADSLFLASRLEGLVLTLESESGEGVLAQIQLADDDPVFKAMEAQARVLENEITALANARGIRPGVKRDPRGPQ